MTLVDADWLRRARERADLAPERPRVPLAVVSTSQAAAHRVGSIEPEIAERMVRARLPVARAADGYCIAAPAERSLAAIARWLHREGIAAHWRNELLTVVDDAGRSVGAVERGAVRVLGLATEAVHLVGIAANGATWVQQRAASKATDPGLWDTLMGGQVAAGERVGTTLVRETLEEAGIAVGDLADLEHCAPILVRRPVRAGYMIERIEVFAGTVPDRVVPVNRDGEVQRFECLPDAALVERLRAGGFTLEATLILGAELERRRVICVRSV